MHTAGLVPSLPMQAASESPQQAIWQQPTQQNGGAISTDAEDSTGGGGKHSAETIEKRRNLNKINARKSRLRKTFLMTNLKQRFGELSEENGKLRELHKVSIGQV